jgi:cell division topological specificity factor
MGLSTLIDRILGRTAEASKNAAKDRLRLVLMHDRSDIPATMMEAIRAEMIQALSKYVEIDTEALEVQLERDAGAIGLVLNIPIRRVKSEAEAADALAAMLAVQQGRGIVGAVIPEPVAKPAGVTGGVTAKLEAIAEETPDWTRDQRDTGELKSSGGTGDLDLAGERAEPND